jgi:Spy/CpxP family protein refolding chaperone
LTDDQQAELRKILDEKLDEMAQSTKRYRRDIDTIRKRYDARIKALLTPEQRERFDEMKQRVKNRWKKEKRAK